MAYASCDYEDMFCDHKKFLKLQNIIMTVSHTYAYNQFQAYGSEKFIIEYTCTCCKQFICRHWVFFSNSESTTGGATEDVSSDQNKQNVS